MLEPTQGLYLNVMIAFGVATLFALEPTQGLYLNLSVASSLIEYTS